MSWLGTNTKTYPCPGLAQTQKCIHVLAWHKHKNVSMSWLGTNTQTYPCPGLAQTQKRGVVKLVYGIPTLSILIIGYQIQIILDINNEKPVKAKRLL
jgi:hypothetical protein